MSFLHSCYLLEIQVGVWQPQVSFHRHFSKWHQEQHSVAHFFAGGAKGLSANVVQSEMQLVYCKRNVMQLAVHVSV